MKPDKRAEIFKKALAANGGDVVAAFRLADKAGRPHPKMPPERVARLRAERAKGRKLIELSAEFGISENHACHLCRGVPLPIAPKPQSVPPVASEVIRLVGTVLYDLAPGWERMRRSGRTRSAIPQAQLVAILAMVGQGVRRNQIAPAMGRSLSGIAKSLEAAREDPQVKQMASVVREFLRRIADGEPTVYALPPLSAPAGVAA